MVTGVVLWHAGEMACNCLTVSDDHVEITLTLEGVQMERAVFPNDAAAAVFALAKMHVYGGS